MDDVRQRYIDLKVNCNLSDKELDEVFGPNMHDNLRASTDIKREIILTKADIELDKAKLKQLRVTEMLEAFPLAHAAFMNLLRDPDHKGHESAVFKTLGRELAALSHMGKVLAESFAAKDADDNALPDYAFNLKDLKNG